MSPAYEGLDIVLSFPGLRGRRDFARLLAARRHPSIPAPSGAAA